MQLQDLRVYLVRHGETAWSLSGQHTGRTDLALTERGEAEAKALRPWLRGIEFTHVMSSPMRRARRTAELAGLSRAVEINDDLSEWNYGDYEGLTSAQIHEGRPNWLVYRDGTPGGESPDAVSIRADRLIQHLGTLKGSVAVFTHGQFGTALAMRWIALPVITAQHFMLGTASLSILAYSASHLDTRVIALWNGIPSVLRDSG
jgi:probable phosphoglycerate mutase